MDSVRAALLIFRASSVNCVSSVNCLHILELHLVTPTFGGNHGTTMRMTNNNISMVSVDYLTANMSPQEHKVGIDIVTHAHPL